MVRTMTLVDFKQVESLRRPGLRDRLRSRLLDVLSLQQPDLGRPRVHFLYLHHVLRDEAANFRELLKTLSRTHEFISHTSAADKIRSGAIDKPYISFSIDDGIKNCLDAADMLDEFGAKCCFFICPSMADNPSREARERFCKEQISLPATDFLNWSDMEALKKRGHEIGNHTRSHFTLSSIKSRAELEQEIGGSRDEIAKRLGDVPHFAWPRGTFGHMSPEAKEIVFATGHKTCASAVRGAHVANAASDAELCIRRDHILGAWPVRHSLYFIGKSAGRASASDNNYNWNT
jgi:peptidoglycan/xylan/chitin deacetylase (PgdA/CDA1 family)